MMKKPVLKIDKLSKSFGAIKANDNLNFNLFSISPQIKFNVNLKLYNLFNL